MRDLQQSFNKRWLVPGYVFCGLAIGHVIYGALAWTLGGSWLLDMGQDAPTGANTLAWFLTAAPLLGLIGWLCLWGVRASQQPLPRSFGWAVGALSLTCTLIWPLTGFPVGVLLGVYIILGKR